MRRTENILKRVFAFLDRVKTRPSGWKKKKEKNVSTCHVRREFRAPWPVRRTYSFGSQTAYNPQRGSCLKYMLKAARKGAENTVTHDRNGAR